MEREEADSALPATIARETTAPETTAPEAAPKAMPLALRLEPVRLSVSLINATLQYRLVLTNCTAAPLGPIAVAADMIGAHASLPPERQLALDGAELAPRHDIASLAPGESIAVSGELRLPLAEITPIRAGSASLLVPLVRLRAEVAGQAQTSAVVVGETPPSPGAPLRPFRLDTGPRIFSAVSQRKIAAAAA